MITKMNANMSDFSCVCSVDFVKWSSQGMLRMSPDAMNALFKPTIDHIIQHLSKCVTPF